MLTSFSPNRRPGFIESIGLLSDELARIRPGIVQVDISIYGVRGPCANRIGFDRTAGGVSGVLALEGSVENPRLPEIFVVNDYITAWLGTVGAIAALKRRALEGGGYRVRISLARLSLWLLQMGVFDKNYAYEVAGKADGHSYLAPEVFSIDTPCGYYQGVTGQVSMSATPGHFAIPLVPHGSSKAEWLPRRARGPACTHC